MFLERKNPLDVLESGQLILAVFCKSGSELDGICDVHGCGRGPWLRVKHLCDLSIAIEDSNFT